MKNTFKKGDKVRCVNVCRGKCDFKIGHTYTVARANADDLVYVEEVSGAMFARRFEKIDEAPRYGILLKRGNELTAGYAPVFNSREEALKAAEDAASRDPYTAYVVFEVLSVSKAKVSVETSAP